MTGFIRCSKCNKMIKINSWSLVLYTEDEVLGHITTPFVCLDCSKSLKGVNYDTRKNRT